jgi:hypothetical protein
MEHTTAPPGQTAIARSRPNTIACSTANDPYLASYYLRIAKDYLVRSQDELRALKREQIIDLAPGADMPSPKLQPNADPLGYV